MPIPERFPRAWLLANALAFQCIWWLLILAGPQQPALAALALAAWLAAHLWLSDTRRADLAALAALPTLGPWLDVLIEGPLERILVDFDRGEPEGAAAI